MFKLPRLQWLGRQSFLDDLASLDPDLYQGLIFLKHYPGNPEELSLNFTIVDEGGLGFRIKKGVYGLQCLLARVWCYSNDRPQTQRQQYPSNARQQTRIHPPRITLSPHETDQGTEYRIFRGPLGHDRPKMAAVRIHPCDQGYLSP